jgi:hypothetical protein
MIISKWIATFLFLTAGTLLSLNLEVSKVGFLFFLVGHVMLTVVFFKQRDWSMLVQNAFFLVIDMIGIYRWFF